MLQSQFGCNQVFDAHKSVAASSQGLVAQPRPQSIAPVGGEGGPSHRPDRYIVCLQNFSAGQSVEIGKLPRRGWRRCRRDLCGASFRR
jgi:hypothetical protein